MFHRKKESPLDKFGRIEMYFVILKAEILIGLFQSYLATGLKSPMLGR